MEERYNKGISILLVSTQKKRKFHFIIVKIKSLKRKLFDSFSQEGGWRVIVKYEE